MKIGRLTLETAAPDDLDARLLAVTGCSAAEIRAILPEATIASFVAQALVPFVKDAPPLADLSVAIAVAGLAEVRSQVIKLYEQALATKGTASGKAKG